MNAVMKKWRLTLGVVVMLLGNIAGLWGQFGKERVIEECEVCNLSEVQAVDFDNDEDIDIVTVSWGKIAWYKNEGKGIFSKQVVLLETDKPIVAIAVVDLDQDGDKDIVFSEFSTNYENYFLSEQKIQWIENDGHFGFSKRFEIRKAGYYIGRIFATDLDGDSDIDILTAENLHFYKNDGKQNFTIENFDEFTDVAFLEDINNDGKIDVLSSGNWLFWHKNNGNGYFNVNRIDTLYPSYSWAAGSGDMDGDGDKDIVVGSLYTNKYELNELRLYKNEGLEKFSPPLVVVKTPEAITSLKIADFNKDGHLDVAVALGYDQTRQYKIVWYKNDGKGNLSTPKVIIENEGNQYAHLTLADLDGDNSVDVISAYRSNELFWHKNDGKGNFSSHNLSSPQIQGAISFKGGDVDADGDNDLVVASFDDHKISLFKNVQKGVFSEPTVVKDSVFGAHDVDIWDVDGDLDLDIVSASIFDHKIAWYKNDNLGNFSEQIILTESLKGANLIDHTDIDKDGLEDIVATGSGTGKVVWFKNLGKGNFDQAVDIATDLDIIQVLLIGDIDNDNQSDIIVVSEFSQDIIILKNINKGTFLQQKLSLVIWCDKVHITDIDGDGDTDLFVSSLGESDRIFFYKNDGEGIFSPEVINTDSIAQSFIHSFDMDNDGDLDLLYGQTHTHVFWMENENGNLYQSNRFKNAKFPYNISEMAPIDLDLDEDLDLAYVSSRADKIAWYENQSNHPSISGFAFWDENNNHQYDSTEQKILNLPVTLEPTASASFTDAQGQYRFYAPEGSYKISVAPDSCWELSTDALSYQVQLEKNKPLVRHFGFKPTSSAPKLKVRLQSSPTRCGFEVPFWLSVHNEACLSTKGKYGLVLSNLATLLSADPTPDQTSGDTLFWNFNRLLGSESKAVKLLFRIAGTDFLGDTIKMQGLAFVENSKNQLQLFDHQNFSSEIRCAYDPNDKLVQPNRVANYTQNYTLFKERMEYTVRFQNTGTDTAFTVVIRDTLDAKLDWKTFKPISSSHPVETHVNKDGAIEFLFRNILLPPSKTNEVLSHGFIRYQILPKKGLPEETEIANTAHIYFDYNPAIVTNTTTNVLVSVLPTKGNHGASTLEEVKTYPNPFLDFILVELDPKARSFPYRFQLYNSQNQLLHTRTLNSIVERVGTEQLPGGLYFYLVKNAQGQVVASGKVIHR